MPESDVIISVTVVSIFVHTPLQVVCFVVCICYNNDPINFLHCLAVDVPDQQLYAKPKQGWNVGHHMTPLRPTWPKITAAVRDPKQEQKNRFGSG